MNELKVIEQREILGRDFRIYGDKENPLFLAKDVADWIDYSDGNVSHMCSMVDKDEKLKIFCILELINGTKQVNKPFPSNKVFLTEYGLYEILMQSRKPIAKTFKKEVKAILKQIRKTGGYIKIEHEDTPEEIMARALMLAQKTLDRKNIK